MKFQNPMPYHDMPVEHVDAVETSVAKQRHSFVVIVDTDSPADMQALPPGEIFFNVPPAAVILVRSIHSLLL